jgi:hypothetical protein
MNHGRCSGTGGRYGDGRCGHDSVFVVGLTGAGVDNFRVACRHHLAQVVSERIDALSANGQVVVAEISKIPT